MRKSPSKPELSTAKFHSSSPVFLTTPAPWRSPDFGIVEQFRNSSTPAAASPSAPETVIVVSALTDAMSLSVATYVSPAGTTTAPLADDQSNAKESCGTSPARKTDRTNDIFIFETSVESFDVR